MAVRKLLQIADLHISEDSPSMLQDNTYLGSLIELLKSVDDLDCMVICGDVVDKGGSEKAYQIAQKIIMHIKYELDIHHILIVPGNHDVSRDLLHALKGRIDIDKDNLWKYQTDKLEYYQQFMKGLELESEAEQVMLSYLKLEEPSMVLIGLNSAWQIGETDGKGAFDIEKLNMELQVLFQKNEIKKDDKYIKIAVFHHRPIIYENFAEGYTSFGQDINGICDYTNWQSVKKILLNMVFIVF